MNKVCSLKTISVIFILLFSLMSVDKVFSDELTEKESLMYETYLKNPEARSAIRIAYWTDVEIQVRNMQRDTPIQLNPDLYITRIEYDGKHTIHYIYAHNMPSLDLIEVKKRLTSIICKDEQVSLLLNIFKGQQHHTYYLYPDYKHIWGEYHISSSDCTMGI